MGLPFFYMGRTLLRIKIEPGTNDVESGLIYQTKLNKIGNFVEKSGGGILLCRIAGKIDLYS